MEYISQYINITILILCVVVGYVWKTFTPLANNYIPLVVTLLGVILSVLNGVALHQAISLDVIAVGMVSGLASTGLHQLVTRLLEQLSNYGKE